MYDDIFLDLDEDESQERGLTSMEEDPDLTFKVAELHLLGLLYCKCEPKDRVDKFYYFFQIGLEENISCEDKDIAKYIPIMGEICYGAIIELYNQEHEKVGGELVR